MKYVDVLFRGLLVMVCSANLAKSQVTQFSEEATKARKESSEQNWDFVMPRTSFLMSPPSQYLGLGVRPPFVNIAADHDIYYSDGTYNVQQISSSKLEAHDTTAPPTFIPYIGARALSNLQEFFKHVKENLAALRLHEYLKAQGIKGFRSRQSQEGGQPRKQSKNDARITTRDENSESKLSPKQVQSLSALLDLTKDYYDPGWKGTNLGLGRRKR